MGGGRGVYLSASLKSCHRGDQYKGTALPQATSKRNRQAGMSHKATKILPPTLMKFLKEYTHLFVKFDTYSRYK